LMLQEGKVMGQTPSAAGLSFDEGVEVDQPPVRPEQRKLKYSYQIRQNVRAPKKRTRDGKKTAEQEHLQTRLRMEISRGFIKRGTPESQGTEGKRGLPSFRGYKCPNGPHKPDSAKMGRGGWVYDTKTKKRGEKMTGARGKAWVCQRQNK